LAQASFLKLFPWLQQFTLPLTDWPTDQMTMMQTLKNALSRTIKIQLALVKALFKLSLIAFKVLLVSAMFASMIFGGISAFLAIGRMHTPAWMLPVWNMLNTVHLADALDGETSPLWEVRDSSIIISRWMAQFLPVAELLATTFGLAKAHWVRAQAELSMQHVDTLTKIEPKIGQAFASVWIVSTVSIAILAVQSLIGTARLVVRCMRRVIRAVFRNRATAVQDATAETVPTPNADLLAETQAPKDTPEGWTLVESTRSNIAAEAVATAEKKVDRRRLESPVARITKAQKNARKEDVPPSVSSPLRRKQSELKDLREAGLVNRRLRGN